MDPFSIITSLLEIGQSPYFAPIPINQNDIFGGHLCPDLDLECSGCVVRIPEQGRMLLPDHGRPTMVDVFSTLSRAPYLPDHQEEGKGSMTCSVFVQAGYV